MGCQQSRTALFVGVWSLLFSTGGFGCGADGKADDDAASSMRTELSAPLRQADSGRPPPPRNLSSGLRRHLYVLDQSGKYTNQAAALLQCLLANTTWNNLANTYAAGESLAWGGVKYVSGNPCGTGLASAQCWVNQGGWTIQAYDSIMLIHAGGGCGGVNGTSTVNGLPVNSATIGDANEACVTGFGSHEVFEMATDGVSADCCDGELPATAPASCTLVGWCPSCTSVCARYNATSCTWNGHTGDGTNGLRQISCPKGTYYYEMVSPASHEFDGTCQGFSAPAQLASGATLSAGGSLTSPDGRFKLSLQTDGNLVLAMGASTLWTSGTSGKGGVRALMQGDGNLVLFTSAGAVVWTSGTSTHSGAALFVQNDGNAVLYAGGNAVWSTKTCCH